MKKWMSMVLAIAMTLAALTACSAGNKSAETNSPSPSVAPSSAAPESAPPDEPVTLRFSFPNSSDAEKQWVADFDKFVKEKYPNVTIEWLHIPGDELLKKITIMLSAGDAPDLIAAQDITDFVKMGSMEPLSGYLNGDPDIQLDYFNPAALEASKVDGEIYTLPTLAIGYALLANTKVLAEAGFQAEDIQTWDDYLKVAAAITKDGTYAHAFAGSAPRFAFRDFYIAAASNGIMYDKLTDPALKENLIELFDFYKALQPYMIPDVISGDWGNIHRLIVDSKVGFIGTGTYYSGYISSFESNSLEYLRPIPFPKGPSADKSLSLIGNLGFGMFNKSKHKDWAWKIMKEALNEQFAAQLAGSINVTALTNIPQETIKNEVIKFFPDTIDAQMEILDDWQKILTERGVPQPKIAGQPEIERIYSEKIAKLFLQKVSSEQLYEEFVAEVKKVEEQF